jgi:hypothetical protein
MAIAEKLSLPSITDKALEAFWQAVVEHFPEAATGDLSPLTTFALERAAENAVEEWIFANVPTTNK